MFLNGIKRAKVNKLSFNINRIPTCHKMGVSKQVSQVWLKQIGRSHISDKKARIRSNGLDKSFVHVLRVLLVLETL